MKLNGKLTISRISGGDDDDRIERYVLAEPGTQQKETE